MTFFAQTVAKNDGWIDYNDLATQTTPLAYTTGNLKITNDGAGAYSTSVYKPSGVTRLWNTSTNQFDFTGLNIGDEVSIRIDLVITTTANNQEGTLQLNFDIGGSPYSLGILNEQKKTIGTYSAVRTSHFYIGNVGTKNNPAELIFTSSDPASIKVNGFFISVKRRY